MSDGLVPNCNHSTRDAEAGGLPQIQGHSDYVEKPYLTNKQTKDGDGDTQL